MFHLLKSDKDILTLQKIEKLENCSIDKVEADNNERNIDNKTEYDVSTSTQSDIQASPLLGNARKEIIKDFKQHTFIGYVKRLVKETSKLSSTISKSSIFHTHQNGENIVV